MNKMLHPENFEWYNDEDKSLKDKIEEVYDTMAVILQHLNCHADAEKLYASSVLSKERHEAKLRKLFEGRKELDGRKGELLFDKNKTDFVFLTVLLSFLDEKAYQLRKRRWETDIFSFDDMICTDGLNSARSQKQTQLAILPRYSCIWEGHSRESNHVLDMNIYLEYSYFVELDGGKINGQYKIRNHILDPGIYGVCPDIQRELFVTAGLSPISKNIVLDVQTYEEKTAEYESNYFTVEPLNSKSVKDVKQILKKVLQDADQDEVDFLVFPEMLGTESMIRELASELEKAPLRNIKFFVAPSVWEKEEKHNNTNTSYVINYEGNLLFGQDKLKPFPMKWDKNIYMEDIKRCDTIHIIHCSGYGSIAVPICRSELDEVVKDILVRRLNVKLLLCPSWSTGSYEFEISIMSGAERCCNTVWCNTCSALTDKKADEKVIGIITGYGKNKIFSDNSFSKRRFPVKEWKEDEKGRGCSNCREKGCYYVKRIYGTDFSEDELEEGVEDK